MTNEATPAEAEAPLDDGHEADPKLARLHARYEREDLRLRMEFARYAALTFFALLFLCIPFLGDALDEAWWQFLMLLLLAFPVLIYAGTLWWRQRIRLPNGKVYEGPNVRVAAGLIMALSLGFFWLVMWVQGV